MAGRRPSHVPAVFFALCCQGLSQEPQHTALWLHIFASESRKYIGKYQTEGGLHKCVSRRLFVQHAVYGSRSACCIEP